MAWTSSGHQLITDNINSFNISTNIHNQKNIFNVNTGTDEEGGQIPQWLSPLEPQQRHQGVRSDRLDGVGNWLLETTEFTEWSNGEGGCVEPVLFCYGGPGVGKTYVSSLVIDRLCDQAGGEDIAVVGLYCDFLAQQEQSSANMLGAILKQLVVRGGVPENMREAFRKARKEFGGRGLRLPDLVKFLKETLASLQRVFICIDALDESPPKQRRDLLESLRDLIRVSPNTRIFLTGRPHIDDEIVKCFGRAVRIPVSPTQDDIKRYLEMRLAGDTDSHAMDDELRADIMRIIPEKISEIFLLVSLNIDGILGEVTLHQRRKKLDEMTNGEGLGDAYAATLTRVKAQQRSKSKLGMDVLMWVSHSGRPLRVDELCHALGVEGGSHDLNIRNIPAIETLLACSMGLVAVEGSSSTVRLIHYTLQEYLSHNPNLFLKPHAMIAEVCLTYLNFRNVRGLSPTLRSVPPTVALVEYAAYYWGAHARRETTESVKTLALKLLGEYDKHIASKLLLLFGMGFGPQPFDQEDRPKGFTGLHGSAYLGCVEITVALLEMNKWDAQATDLQGNTAIMWAARRGHEGVVRALLEWSDVNPNQADEWNRTPVSRAAENGHEGVVKALLERSDVNPNQSDEWSRTPLSRAAENGHEGAVKALLERSDVNPDAADTTCDHTPLSWAAGNGHEGAVRILLERSDVNPNQAGKWGRTLLSWAAENGHEGIVRALLERGDVNPNEADEWRRTPLSRAAGRGHEGVVRALLERSDISPDTADTKYDGTPLSWAVARGHVGVVRTLLERSDVNPDTVVTISVLTSLLWAARTGHEGVVRALLERCDINPDTADTKYGQTPLLEAAEHGHERVVRILLERSDVNPNQVDKCARTPLSRAAERGHEGVVRALLERRDVNPDTADCEDGRTPLSWAAENGREGVVRALLERSDVNPDTADTEYGRTPLSWAAQNGHERVVRILLERSEVNPDQVDKWTQTPLSQAAGRGHEGVVRALLGRSDVNSTAGTGYGQTPLSWAAENGHEGVVRALLERSDVIPDTTDTGYGRTPLSWAAENGHEGVVRTLLERNDVDPNAMDTQCRRTPLQWALENRHERTAKLLQERTDLAINYAVSPQPPDLFSPEPSETSEPPSKRARIF